MSVHRTRRRLRWIADRYDGRILLMCMMALLEGTGAHDEYEQMWRECFRLSEGEEKAIADMLAFAETRMPPYTRFNPYLPWLARRLDTLFSQPPTLDGPEAIVRRAHELIMRMRSIVEWAAANKIDLHQYDDLTALEKARHDASERVRKAMPQGQIVHAFDDGWTVQHLTTQQQLTAEGDAMQNCLDLGGYTHANEIYSLRDPKGAPHATMDFCRRDMRVRQLRGKQNAWPQFSYTRKMLQFRVACLDYVSRLQPVAVFHQHVKIRIDLEREVVGAYHRIDDPSPFRGLDDASIECILAGPKGRDFVRDGDVVPLFALQAHDTVSRRQLGSGIFIGCPGISWRAFVDHRVLLMQSYTHPVITDRPEDELVAAIVWSATTERIDQIFAEDLVAARKRYQAQFPHPRMPDDLDSTP